MPRTSSDNFECYLCGEKFDSEMSKDFHMENCMLGDGPNSLDSSYDPPIRALLRQSPSHGVWPYRSPPHAAPNQTHQRPDFSSAVGSRIEPTQLTAQPLIPQGYSDPAEEEMRRRIQYPPPKPKYPVAAPVANNTPISQYVQEAGKNQLFRPMNIQTSQFQPRVPQYPVTAPPPPPHSTAPFGYSRSSQLMYTPRAPPPLPETVPFNRHSSEARVLVPPHAPADLSSSKLVIRTAWREASQSQHDGNLAQQVQRHNHPISGPPPPPSQAMPAGPVPEAARRAKFEVKLVWEKQQPTLETALEYLDNVDTEQILLKWDPRKEVFNTSVRLSPGEHTGSLAIPDTELVVYEVHPFNVSQFSVSVQEIKLDLIDIAPRYNLPPEPVQRPLYSQIDVHSKHLATNTRLGELRSQSYLSEKREDQQPVPRPFQIVREERRDTVPISAPRAVPPMQEFRSLPQEQSVPPLANRPLIAPKHREELSKQEISSPMSPPFQVGTEERRVSLSGVQREQSVARSSQPAQEERSRVEFRIPAGGQPLPPPRNKPAAVDTSRESSEYKRQEIEQLREELTHSRAEKEEGERLLGAEVRKWQSNFNNLQRLKQTRDNEYDLLNRDREQLNNQLASARTQLSDKPRQLEERAAALHKEKEEAVKNREEARVKQQLSEKRNKELEGKIQDLLDESQKKIQNIQMERDSYKAAAYKYKTERDRIKLNFEGERATHEELKSVHKQLQGDYQQRLIEIDTLANKLTQTETVKFSNYAQKSRELASTTERPAESVRPGFDRGYMSLGSMEDQKKAETGEYFMKDKPQDRRPVPARKPSLVSGYELTPKVNSDYLRDHISPTDPPAPSGNKSFKKKPSVHNRVQELEARNADTPKATPRFSRNPSKIEGLESYRPELLTTFIQKQTPVFYKSSSVSATRLSYLKRPESHLGRQVLVRVRDVYRLGTLQAVFSKRFSFPSKTQVIAGVKLEEAAGTSSGQFEGARYFECEHNHALFVILDEVFIHVA